MCKRSSVGGFMKMFSLLFLLSLKVMPDEATKKILPT
jgi:hypothetical protein